MGRTLHNREADCVYGAALTTDQYSCVFCNAAGLRNAEDEDEKKNTIFCVCVCPVSIFLYTRGVGCRVGIKAIQRYLLVLF